MPCMQIYIDGTWSGLTCYALHIAYITRCGTTIKSNSDQNAAPERFHGRLPVAIWCFRVGVETLVLQIECNWIVFENQIPLQVETGWCFCLKLFYLGGRMSYVSLLYHFVCVGYVSIFSLLVWGVLVCVFFFFFLINGNLGN